MKGRHILNYSMLILVLIWIVPLTITVSCDSNAITTETGKILTGKHEVKEFEMNYDRVNFVWVLNNGATVKSSIEASKLRVVNEATNTPYVKFRWRATNYTDIDNIMEYSVVYMELHCTEDFFTLYDKSKEPVKETPLDESITDDPVNNTYTDTVTYSY